MGSSCLLSLLLLVKALATAWQAAFRTTPSTAMGGIMTRGTGPTCGLPLFRSLGHCGHWCGRCQCFLRRSQSSLLLLVLPLVVNFSLLSACHLSGVKHKLSTLLACGISVVQVGGFALLSLLNIMLSFLHWGWKASKRRVSGFKGSAHHCRKPRTKVPGERVLCEVARPHLYKVTQITGK